MRLTTSTPRSLATTSSLPLSLFSALLSLAAVSSVAPAPASTEFDIETLLAVLNHGANLFGDCLSKLLGPGKFNPMENYYTRRLI